MGDLVINYLIKELCKVVDSQEVEEEYLTTLTDYALKHVSSSNTPKMSVPSVLRRLQDNAKGSEDISKLYSYLKSKDYKELEHFATFLGFLTIEEKTFSFLYHSNTDSSRTNKENSYKDTDISLLKDRIQNSVSPRNSRQSYSSNKEFSKKKEVPRNIPQAPSWMKERPYLFWNFQSINLEREKNECTQLGALPKITQESLLIDDILFCLCGIDGDYILSRKGNDSKYELYIIDDTVDHSTQDSIQRLFPLCYNFNTISKFVEENIRYECGRVNNALAAAIKTYLREYHIFVARLESDKKRNNLSLQKIWYIIGDMMTMMAFLAKMVTTITDKEYTGGRVLTMLHEQVHAAAGYKQLEDIAFELTKAACVPYFEILNLWINKGVIADRCFEFFVEESDQVKKEDYSKNLNDNWEKRYKLCRERVPVFLDKVADMILRTGKYLNVILLCGERIENPQAEMLVYSQKETYSEKIEIAYKFASRKLLDLLINSSDLMGHLRSLKHYFLMDQGDFIVQFFDMAEEELRKDINDIMPSRLGSLVELAIRTSVVNSDRYKDNVRVELFPNDLLSQMFKILRIAAADQPKMERSTLPGPVTGLEAFAFDYEIHWPLSLILNRHVIACYQMIFRHLLYCKHVERMLGKVWLLNNMEKMSLLNKGNYSSAFLLRHKMVTFIQNLEYYMFFEVIEPNWLNFIKKMQEVNNIDEVLVCHSDFLNSCLKECMLTQHDLLHIIRKLLKLCVSYDEYMLSFCAKDSEACAIERSEECVSQDQIEHFHKEFTSSLMELLTILTSHRQNNTNDKILNMIYRLELNNVS